MPTIVAMKNSFFLHKHNILLTIAMSFGCKLKIVKSKGGLSLNLLPDITSDFSRRAFLRMSAGAAAALAVTSLPTASLAKRLEIKPKKVSLADCLSLDEITMAKQSSYVQHAYDFLLQTAGEIQNSSLRHTTLAILRNPAPTLMERYPGDAQKEQTKQQLVKAGYIKPDAQYTDFLPPYQSAASAVIPFYAAPGSGYASHHCYPGGLATHVAVNVNAALGFYNAYKDAFRYPMNRDIVIAAQTLHDLHKPWVFQWQPDGSSRKEYPLAGAGAHHVLSIAELIHRQMPASLIIAMACAHNHPGTPADEQEVMSWLRAAAIIAGQDAVMYGLLESDGQSLPLPRRAEGFITHLGDHDYVLSVPAAKWMIARLGEIARHKYAMSEPDLQSKKFNAFRNYLFSQLTLEQLYLVWSTEGDEALLDLITATVNP